jgi:hypothetical protein
MKKTFLYPFLVVTAVFFLTTTLWSAGLVEDTREAIRLGKFDRALKLLNVALEENPLDTNAHLLMTEYYLALQDFGSAELSTERTLVLNRSYAPLVAQAYYLAGERAMRDHLRQALALYETAVALDPSFRTKVRGKYMTIGDDMLARGAFTTALSAYTQEIGLNPAVRKVVADTVFVRGQSLLGNNDRTAEVLFSYVVSLDPSYSSRITKAKTDHELYLLSRAREAMDEERRRLGEQSPGDISKDVADRVAPSPVWETVFREEYIGRGMDDEDDTIIAPSFGPEVWPGDRIVVTGREFQFYDDGWKIHRGGFKTIGKSLAVDGMVGIRAGRGEKVTLEIQRPVER